MTIDMYQADRNFVTPANDASLYSALARDYSGVLNRGNKFVTSITGLSLTVGTGQALIQGRLVEITVPETITLPENASGNICLVVDLTKTNDVSGSAGDSDYTVTVNQVYVSAVTGTLTQDDLNNGGFVYELPIAAFTSSATTATVSSVIKPISRAETVKPKYVTSFSDYNDDNSVEIALKNGFVQISGVVKNANTINPGNNHVMFSIPDSRMWPRKSFRVINKGSGIYRYLVTYNTDGTVTVSNYAFGSSENNLVAGSTLYVDAVFMAVD
ncbi:hypothetical protein [Leuconostoc gasicomitatum]|uniref:hypothetical protein n=1 Tax=Leuconostoc gasicomitatum TaxID=115778 RepID=UPI001CC7F4E2|nr:hypothetical protein [Leuconostoc gasicomitatum]